MQNVNASAMPWYSRIKRWGQTNLTEDDPERNNLEFWQEQWRKTGVQGIIVNCDGIVSYCKTSFEEQYRAEKLGDRDLFDDFMKAAERMGIAVVARMDTNRAAMEFYRRHPQWFCVDVNGEPILRQGRCVICVNSDYFEAYLGPLLREIIERYHPAGFAENSWSGLDQGTICYCENCRRGFREESGHELPERVDWDDPVFREWIRWNYRKRLENWEKLNSVTREAGGEHCCYMGMINANPTNPEKRFVDIRELTRRAPIIFTDHQSRDALNGFEQSCVNGLLLREAAGRDVVIPQSSAFYVRGNRTFRLSSTPYEESEKWLESGAAGGISPWYHHVSGAEYDRRQFANSLSFFQWHRENEEYLYSRQSLADIGIVWSRINTDFYGRNERHERVSLPWSGWTTALTEGRLPFLPVHAADLDQYRERLRTLILPDLAAMEDAEIDAVNRHLEAGGNLVITGRSATLDADGQRRTRLKLWDKLGIHFTGDTEGAFVSRTADWEHPDAHTYISLPSNRHPVLNGFEATDLIGFGGGVHIVESGGPLRRISGYISPFPIFPPEFSWIRERRDDLGTIFAGTLDSGARVVCFPSDVDRCFGRDRLPDHGRLLANAVAWANGGEPRLKVSGPGRLLVHPYAQEDRTLLHVVNMSCCDRMPGYVTEIYPVGPIEIELSVGDAKISYVRLQVAKGEVPFVQRNGTLRFQIERLKDHELVVIG